jgi:chromosome segregation ATPase
MLDLEMAEYERTIKALNFQIISKDKEINDLKADIASSNEKYNKLKEDFNSLEKNKDTIDEKNTKLKQLLVKAKKDVSEAKAHEAQHLSSDATMKAQIESQALELENYKVFTLKLKSFVFTNDSNLTVKLYD